MSTSPVQRPVVLVTGGAGEIGSAISTTFAANGYIVVATYNRDHRKAERLIASLPGTGHQIVQAPTTDAAAIDALRQIMVSTFGRLDVLVNNAGITTPVAHNDLDALTDEWIDRIMQTNFRGGFAMVRAMRSLLEQAAEITGQSSLVVNISSIAGIYGIGSNVAYCASKAAVDSMTRSLARVLAPKIRMVSVSPGFVEGEYTKNFDPSFLKNQMDNTPMGRFATGQDVANAVYSLATSLTFTTGNIITVDGGRLLK
ncbi:SDR family NAD(P)-dependent oxidoreductase [Arsenicibacter rosenii]|uniref:Short-chain dehydrogenase n=1 Tax=Arsenicibacter rosenii TaxID=1750698 RepID=A0A1S2VA64_9BACT|nr:SDR family oxidoreductase [Arsenicibacter rosenii]OIN55621.1 short-chain dehydrogenase [Arsenicibacter rosenii]